MLEIVVNGSDELILEETTLFNKDDIISFSLLLSYGKINNIKEIKFRNACGYKIPVSDMLSFLRNKVSSYKDIRIWYSSFDNEDVSTLYFLINYLNQISEFNIYVCDVYDEKHYSLSSYTDSQINILLDKTCLLTNDIKKKYNDEWIRLEEENGDLRIISDGSLVSYDYEYLDLKIINLLKKYDSVYYWTFIGECVKLRLCNFYGDIFFTERVNEMIKLGKIDVCEVKQEIDFMGRIVENKYIKVN